MTESTAGPAPAEPAQPRFRFWRHIRRSLYTGLVIAAFNGALADYGFNTWQFIAFIAVFGLAISLSWTLYRYLMFGMPDRDGTCTTVALVAGLFLCSEYWEKSWAKWLVIPVAVFILTGVVFDHRFALRDARRKQTIPLSEFTGTETPGGAGGSYAAGTAFPHEAGHVGPRGDDATLMGSGHEVHHLTVDQRTDPTAPPASPGTYPRQVDGQQS